MLAPCYGMLADGLDSLLDADLTDHLEEVFTVFLLTLVSPDMDRRMEARRQEALQSERAQQGQVARAPTPEAMELRPLPAPVPAPAPEGLAQGAQYWNNRAQQDYHHARQGGQTQAATFADYQVELQRPRPEEGYRRYMAMPIVQSGIDYDTGHNWGVASAEQRLNAMMFNQGVAEHNHAVDVQYRMAHSNDLLVSINFKNYVTGTISLPPYTPQMQDAGLSREAYEGAFRELAGVYNATPNQVDGNLLFANALITVCTLGLSLLCTDSDDVVKSGVKEAAVRNRLPQLNQRLIAQGIRLAWHMESIGTMEVLQLQRIAL